MTDRHRSFIAIGAVAALCALALAFLLPGSPDNNPTTGTPDQLSLNTLAPTTTSTTNAPATPSTSVAGGIPTAGASPSASGGRGSEGGNAVAPLGGSGGTAGGGGVQATTTTIAPPPPTTTTTATTPTTNATPGPQNCDGQPDIGPASGVGWSCTFDSEFTGSALNTNQWLIQQTAHGGYHSGNECYVDNPANVNVSGGSLNLTAVGSATPFTCQSDEGSYQSQVTSGMVTTYTHFSQEFGLFEIRAKLPANTAPGIQSDLWLWPSVAKKYGVWPASGEIDFAEWFSQLPNEIIPQIHYNSVGNDPNQSATCAVNPDQYNTYGVEWTPLAITILVNGTVCDSDDWNPQLPLSKPAPFDQPFIISMTQAVGTGTDKPTATTQFPSTMSIQWVRVWSENGS